jgi:hypothetical protein
MQELVEQKSCMVGKNIPEQEISIGLQSFLDI